jgi:hypothetical protein
MLSWACCAFSLLTLGSCAAYPSVVVRVESWSKVTLDGSPCLQADLACDSGLTQLLRDYPTRVHAWLGPVSGNPADCIVGHRWFLEDPRGPRCCFRLDALHQANEKVVRADRVALRLVVQWAYSYDVVATVDGMDPEQIGLRGVSEK